MGKDKEGNEGEYYMAFGKLTESNTSVAADYVGIGDAVDFTKIVLGVNVNGTLGTGDLKMSVLPRALLELLAQEILEIPAVGALENDLSVLAQ